MEIKYKQYVVVPKRPKMSKGKIASQVAHATFMALENQRETSNEGSKWDNIDEWKIEGQCVIVLECKSQIELMNIAEYCKQWKVPHHLYIDEGMTEIPMGTATALATGVVPEEMFWMFSQLKLFRG